MINLNLHKKTSFELDLADIHIWLMSHHQSIHSKERINSLSNVEQHQLEQFLSKERKENFINTRAFMRDLLSKYTKQNTTSLQFSSNQHGKPFLSSPNKEKIQFNLSHSKNWSVLAITKEKNIGVDIETIRALSYQTKIAEKYFSKEELNDYYKSSQQSKIFFHYWTQKEAYCKALGTGIAYTDLKKTEILRKPWNINQLHYTNNAKNSIQNWYIQTFHINKKNLFSIAIQKKNPNIQINFFPPETLNL